MNKPSLYYRYDSSEGIDPMLRDYLDAEYFGQLENVEVIHRKFLVVFAGGNAVGKSVLAEKIAHELQGLRLENDGVKRTLLIRHPELAMTDKLHLLTWQYTMDLYRRLDSLTTNGLVVRDGVITWYYDQILPIFEERGYELFVIGYNLSEAKMRELIARRGDTATSTEQRFHELIPSQQLHLKNFFAHYTPDIMLNDKTVFDHDQVIEQLKQCLIEGEKAR